MKYGHVLPKFIVPSTLVFSAYIITALVCRNAGHDALPQPTSIPLHFLQTTLFKKSKFITIVSHGYNPGKINTGLRQANRLCKHNVVHGDCVSFDYNDNWDHANFAQEHDLAYLTAAITTAKNNFPRQKMILYGISRGASTIVRYMGQEQTENVHALILESPFASMHDVAKHLAQGYWLGWLPFHQWLALNIIEYKHPNFKRTHPQPLDTLPNIDKTIPILLICCEDDDLVPCWSTQRLAHALFQQGHQHVYLLTLE